jgi:hypothetical protein
MTSQNLLPYVKKPGYLAFYEANDSNHRGLFIDLHEAIIDNKVELKRPPKRHIGSKSKKEISYKYKQDIQNQCLKHKIYERAEDIGIQSAFSPLTPELNKKIISLDEQMTEIVLAVEKSQVPREFKIDWSAVIHNQLLVCKFWAIQRNLEPNRYYKTIDRNL